MSQNTKILIVEDEVLIAEFIAEILSDNNFSKIKIANSYNDALYEMQHFTPEVILMDINLGESQSGIELSYKKNNEASVIFLTGQFDKTTINKAIQSNPESYLTKPIKKHDLIAALNLCIAKKASKTFKFKDGYDTVSLRYDEMLYLNADGNYVHIYTFNKKFTIRQTLAGILRELPEDIFKQTHRSFAVNIKKVTRRSSGKIFLNNLEVPVSRFYDKVLKKSV